MRRYLQQVRRQLVARADAFIGWLLAAVATAVYLLTLEPTASFWDCGEFIAISYGLQVGHPPGAPFYQLLAHAFGWFAGGNILLVARCCNALSAVAAGFTVMLLYHCIRLLQQMRRDRAHKPSSPVRARLGALVGSFCYLFCDTAWFSAVESEVYALAMLLAAATLWAMLRWYCCPDTQRASRWLLLAALLLGLGACTHLLTLLTAPALLLLFIFRWRDSRRIPLNLRLFLLALAFFAIGLTPYLVIPIRAAANPPINQGRPATAQAFRSYLSREQYEHAPLYPRMWRHHEHDALYNASWCGGDTNLAGNLRFYGSYQLTYMYFRYLMWNFSGRYNDRQGYGSPQNGQFITGIPFFDRLLVGTAAPLPDSLPTRGHNVYYLLPLLLGLLGIAALADDRRTLWTVLTLFLMGGIILSIYLNHPCYEPRERDYAYILSFFAFAILIAFGAEGCADSATRRWHLPDGLAALLLAVPLLMACQNWDDHDRSGRYVARDAGANILNSCDSNDQHALLFCYGDNDTFPLWYLQSVEQCRLDVEVQNIGLIGTRRFLDLLNEGVDTGRPIYFTHYAYNQYHNLFQGRLQLEGNAYRLAAKSPDSVAVDPFYRHAMQQMRWHPLEGVYIDETCCKFLEQYWRDIVLLADNLNGLGRRDSAAALLHKTLGELPVACIQDVTLIDAIARSLAQSGDRQGSLALRQHLRAILREQLDYYHTIPPRRQATMPFTLGPREALWDSLK